MGCQPGALRVLKEITGHWSIQTFPWNVSPSGCYNPNSFLDGTRTPSAHAKGEAIDIGIKVPFRGRHSVGQQIFHWLHANRARLGIVQLIYDRQIWSATNQPTLIRPYNTNPHVDHIHCQFNATAARNPSLTAHPFGTPPATPDQEDDDEMTDDQVQYLAQTITGGIQTAIKEHRDVLAARLAEIKKELAEIKALG